MGATLAQQMRDIAERANPLYQEIIEGCRCGQNKDSPCTDSLCTEVYHNY